MLPDYMIPSSFMKLECFPYTPNGKLDRNAVPAPEWSNEKKYVAPQSVLELELVNIWQSVLNVSPIGVTDNFFELGGHSLSAIKLVNSINQQLKSNLTIKDLFMFPTIRSYVGSQKSICINNFIDNKIKILPLSLKSACYNLFAIPPLGGNSLCYLTMSQLLDIKLSFYGMQANSRLKHSVIIIQMLQNVI